MKFKIRLQYVIEFLGNEFPDLIFILQIKVLSITYQCKIILIFFHSLTKYIQIQLSIYSIKDLNSMEIFLNRTIIYTHLLIFWK